MIYLDLLQWPGMALGLIGAFLVSSSQSTSRFYGFALWIVSNLCWVIWSYHTKTWGLMAMQAVFLITSMIGCRNNSLRARNQPYYI